MIHKITPSVDLNWWLKRLNTQHNELTNQKINKSSKLLSNEHEIVNINLWGLVPLSLKDTCLIFGRQGG